MIGTRTSSAAPSGRPQQMREQDIQDFEVCQRAVASGFPDPGRKLLMPPQLPYEFEYIPLVVPRYHQVCDKKSSSPALFSSQETEEYPLRRWEISVYAALLAAHQPLANPVHIRSTRSDAAFREVVELVNLYRRRINPTPPPEPMTDQERARLQADLAIIDRAYPPRDTMMQVWESPDEDFEQESSVNTPTSRINDLWSDEDIMGTMNTTTTDLPDSYDDPVVTPAVLSTRLYWRPPRRSEYGEEGSMRFATSSDFTVDPDEPQE
ncbi:hypothetical protein FRC04_001634 [Tulasnella sp. 424]|nr:hypothetical protein FRC04_001634 [Tulasnella sp. 424]